MSEYDKLIGQLGKMFNISFSLKDWFGTKIIGFERGEDPQKTIVISGSAHGDCENSLYATIDVLLKTEVANRIVAILSRDPTGFYKLTELSEKIFRKKLSSVNEMIDYISRMKLTLIEKDGYRILSYGNMALVFVPEEIKSYRQLETSFNPRKFDELEGFYLVIPEIWKSSDPRSRTYRISDDRLFDLDYLYEAPDYMTKLVDKILEYEPILFIDLDCWENNSFCIVTDDWSLQQLDFYIDLVLDQIQNKGVTLLTNSDLKGFSKMREGIYSIKKKVFAKEISKSGIPFVKFIAPKGDIQLLATSTLSLINGLAFVPL